MRSKFPILGCESSISSNYIHQYVLDSDLHLCWGFRVLSDDQSFYGLRDTLFCDLEGDFYLYTEAGGLLKSVTDRFIGLGIIVETSESSFYFNPYQDGGWFMRITLADFIDLGKIPAQLEKIKSGSKHYYRHTLRLSGRMRAYLDNKELVFCMDGQPKDLIEVKLGLWGVGVNLKEAYSRIRKYFKKE